MQLRQEDMAPRLDHMRIHYSALCGLSKFFVV